MTVEEMITWLTMHENPRYEPIIAALRAGQEIRQRSEELYALTPHIAYAPFDKALVEYDAATKGGQND